MDLVGERMRQARELNRLKIDHEMAMTKAARLEEEKHALLAEIAQLQLKCEQLQEERDFVRSEEAKTRRKKEQLEQQVLSNAMVGVGQLLN